MKGGEAVIRKTYQKSCLILFFLIYMATVLWYTVLKRSTGYHVAQFEFFWSYRKWFAGDKDLGNEILANIAMFIPFGFLFSSVLQVFSQKRCRKRTQAVVAILAAALFSLSIEVLQLVKMRGMFEWDDVISNSLGAAIGWALFMVIQTGLSAKRASMVILSVGTAFVIVCLAVLIRGRGVIGVESDTSSRAFCFQVDDAALEGETLQLTGFAFRYDHNTPEIRLFLRSTGSSKMIEMETEYRIPRSDVNTYFLCEKEYTNVGFVASAEIPDRSEEYEVMIGFPRSVSVSTGVFITGANVHYFPEGSFTAPDLDVPSVRDGVLRVYRPDYHCWVYQYEGDLYWVAEEGFNFEEDGTTYIQYQLWTTQIENLPEKRLAHHNYWDNIGGHFEKYEVEGDFGPYRVMKRELPTAYSITSIVTGYYRNGEWVWKNYFRPIYKFMNENLTGGQ